jgi:uncharacterized protein
LSLPEEATEATTTARPARSRLVWILPGVAVAAVGAALAFALLDAGSPRTAPGTVELNVPPQAEGAAPDPALVESSPDGPLPIIGKDGRQPWQVYARKFDAAGRLPRIAIVISGLGLDSDATRAAIAHLPAPVSLAFSPYAHDLSTWIAAARQAGHEVLLGLPMEPTDFPRQDPGPRTLLTSLEPEQNLERLRWILGRGTAYVGLVGVQGDRFVTARASLEPILDALKGRGLLFVDDHDATASVAGPLGHELGMAWAITDRQLDSDATQPAIDKMLADLEATAAQGGAALGLGGLYPVTIERVIAWAQALQAKGIALAPATAVAMHQVLPQKSQ